MSDNIIGLRAAAELIGCLPASLAYWIDVGDVLPTPDIATWATHDGKIYRDFKKLELTLEDIERYKIEMRRRSFTDFKTEYADVYQPDDGPGREAWNSGRAGRVSCASFVTTPGFQRQRTCL